eukprot:4307185-Pyramimonas_sp.AAC.1
MGNHWRRFSGSPASWPRFTGLRARPRTSRALARRKKSPDTMLDSIVMSESAVPVVRDISAVKDVPWKPHCALVVSLRSSALQLMTRVLELPAKLPQCPRPRAGPKEGSKSQRQNANLQIARAEALARRREKFRT